MSTELARQGTHLPSVTDAGFLDEVRMQLAPKATDSELRHFAQVVAKTQLDPWSRQIYLIGRWDKRAGREVHRPQTSIDGLRLIAERTGKYEGQTPIEWCGPDGAWVDVWLKPDKPRAARCGVFKAGRAIPTYSVALWDEYAVTGKNGALTGLWPTKPALMIGKCAEALALRKVFPQETSGLYIAEEMGQADAEAITVAEVVEPAVIEPPKPAKWQPSSTQITELRELYVKTGWHEQDKDHERLRLQLAATGAGNAGELAVCLAALAEDQFAGVRDALVEAAVTETFDATPEPEAKS